MCLSPTVRYGFLCREENDYAGVFFGAEPPVDGADSGVHVWFWYDGNYHKHWPPDLHCGGCLDRLCYPGAGLVSYVREGVGYGGRNGSSACL